MTGQILQNSILKSMKKLWQLNNLRKMKIMLSVLLSLIYAKLISINIDFVYLPIALAIISYVIFIINKFPYIGIIIFFAVSSFFGSMPLFISSIFNIAAYQIVLLLLILVYLNKKNSGEMSLTTHAPHYLIFISVIFCLSIFVIGLLNSHISHFKAIKNGITFSSFFLLFFLTFNFVRTKKEYKTVIYWIVGIVVILNVFSLVEYCILFLRSKGSLLIRNGAFSIPAHYGPNHFCAYIVAVLPFVFCILFTKEPRDKKIIALSLFLLFISLILTFSRAGWLGLSFVFFCFLFFAFKKTIKIFILLLTILIVIGSVFIVKPEYLSKFNYRLTENTLVSRKILTNVAVSIIQANPLTGVGPDRFKEEKYNYISKRNKYIGEQYSVHNSFLDLAADQGLVVSGLFLILIIAFELYAFRSIRKINSIEAKLLSLSFPIGFLGFLITSLFSSTFSGNMIQLIPLFMGLTVCVISLELNKAKV